MLKLTVTTTATGNVSLQDPFPTDGQLVENFLPSTTTELLVSGGQYERLQDQIARYLVNYSGTCTISTATPGVVTKAAHGLVASQTVEFDTAADEVCTISAASPAVVTLAAHGLVAGQEVVFATTGTLPAPLAAGTKYYVSAAGLAGGAFRLNATPGGADINTTVAGTGVHTLGALPYPLYAGTKYYVSAAGLAAGTFRLNTTPAGSDIATTGTATYGVHTVYWGSFKSVVVNETEEGRTDEWLELQQRAAAPLTRASFGKFYVKSDTKPYFLTSAGVEMNLGMIGSAPLVFKGAISLNTDFPLVAAVQSGWMYRVLVSVTDNAGATYTNTGQSFVEKSEVAWNGTNWTVLGTEFTQMQITTFVSTVNIKNGGTGPNYPIQLPGLAIQRFIPLQATFILDAANTVTGDASFSLGTTAGGAEIAAAAVLGITTLGQSHVMGLTGVFPAIAGNAALDVTRVVQDSGTSGTLTVTIAGLLL